MSRIETYPMALKNLHIWLSEILQDSDDAYKFHTFLYVYVRMHLKLQKWRGFVRVFSACLFVVFVVVSVLLWFPWWLVLKIELPPNTTWKQISLQTKTKTHYLNEKTLILLAQARKIIKMHRKCNTISIILWLSLKIEQKCNTISIN